MVHPRNLYVAQRRLKVYLVVMVMFATTFFFYGRKREDTTNGRKMEDTTNGRKREDTNNGEACSKMFMPWKIQSNSSEYLLSKLSDYKIRHQKCSGEARNLERFSELGSGNKGCKFVVWISYEGLGNKMLSLTSAFVYALLTDRVLLVDRDADLPQLFCEPFPSWFLPVNFPHRWMHSLDEDSDECLGNLNKNRCKSKVESLPSVVYMYLGWISLFEERSFFCEYEQELLQKYTKWLFIRANAYYVPGLHLIRNFSHELQKLFPEPEKTFGTLARLMLQPTEAIRKRTIDYFKQHLVGGDQLIGIQLRIYDNFPEVFTALKEQLWSCLLSNNILRNIAENNIMSNTTTDLLVTSLHRSFAQELQERLSVLKVPGVKIHTPSFLGEQKTGDAEHDKQALEEMLLLSMSDVLITTARSTFGYVAQGLSGLRPWILRGSYETGMQQLTCSISHSQDPGFLFNSPLRDCDCQGEQLSHLFSSDLGGCTDDWSGCLQITLSNRSRKTVEPPK